jgi:hypothetical protein
MRAARSIRTVHRRGFLRCGLTGAACLALTGAGRAQPVSNQFFPKSTKLQAGYLDRAQPELRLCGACVFFLAPDDCSIVEGPISPLGSCDYYGD